MADKVPFYKQVSKLGRPAVIKTPEEFLAVAYEYFEATEARAWKKKDWVGKDAKEVNRESITPYSIGGFCVFLGLSRHWWNELRKAKEKAGDTLFLEVIAHVEDVMYTQKFEGATTGHFNPSIIARDLGLVEKIESENKNTEISAINISINRGEAHGS